VPGVETAPLPPPGHGPLLDVTENAKRREELGRQRPSPWGEMLRKRLERSCTTHADHHSSACGTIVACRKGDGPRSQTPSDTTTGVHMNDSSLEASSRNTWRGVSRALSSSITMGTGLGIIAAALFVALEPNMRLALPLTFIRLALRFVPAFILAFVLTMGIAMVLPAAAGWSRQARRSLGVLLPLTGFSLAVVVFNVPVRFYVPGIRGLVLSLAELVIPMAFLGLALVLALLLGRWTRALAARPPGAVGRPTGTGW